MPRIKGLKVWFRGEGGKATDRLRRPAGGAGEAVRRACEPATKADTPLERLIRVPIWRYFCHPPAPPTLVPADARPPSDLSSPSASRERREQADAAVASTEGALWERLTEILPYRRCITGEGLRDTLRAIGRRVPIEITEVPSATPVLDWTVPPEWRVHEAYIARPDGTRVVDWATSPLHLVQYSSSVRRRMPLREARAHLHTLPDHPDWIPYRTDYYSDGWGFCLRQRTLDELAAEGGEDAELELVIDAEHVEGSLSYGEVVVPGRSHDEILISAHACHPALANDNASSIAVATALAEELVAGPTPRHTVRFVFAPGTIGAIAWLDRNRPHVERLRHGLVLANLGDAGGFTYKRTRRGTLGAAADVDRAVVQVLRGRGLAHEIRPFDPFGYDERQYGSPGFDLPVGRLTRTPHGEYPEYHTSADDLSLVSPAALVESLSVLREVVAVLDGEERLVSRHPFGEPQLGRRALYHHPDGRPHGAELQAAIGWVLNLSDGRHGLRDVADHSGLPFATVRAAADRLLDAQMLTRPTAPR